MAKSVKLIAELCQNHNGRFDLVRQMVDAAAEAGATHVKLQAIYADRLAFRPQFEEGLIEDGRQLSIKRPYSAEYARLKSLELTAEECSRFVEITREAGMIPMTTCFARADVASIVAQGFKAIKVASYDCASYPLLRELAANFEDVYVSTGATFDDEVVYASRVLHEAMGKRPFAFLHCVTIYPTPLEEMNLNRLEWLRNLAPQVGFSDHSLVVRDDVVAAKGALAMGAEIIERHFTILDADKSRDGPVSITPKQLRDLASFARRDQSEQREILDREHPSWRVMLGQVRRAMSDAELLNRDYYRGRFASPRHESQAGRAMIFNWEETPIA